MTHTDTTPTDAITVEPWTNLDGAYGATEGVFRFFTGSSWVIPVVRDGWLVGPGAQNITVTVQGRQFPDGRTERWVTTDLPEDDSQLPLPVARMLAESFAAAAAEIDRMAV